MLVFFKNHLFVQKVVWMGGEEKAKYWAVQVYGWGNQLEGMGQKLIFKKSRNVRRKFMLILQ